MTERHEIERLLNQTGRTLEGLPTEEGYLSADDCAERYRSICIAMQGSRFKFNVPFMIHQSDVIELLIGALRDALDKPMQKPLTLEELDTLGRAEVWEERRKPHRLMKTVAAYTYIAACSSEIDKDMAEVFGYNSEIRTWITIPSEKEMEAVAWET